MKKWILLVLAALLVGCSGTYEPGFERYVGTDAVRPAGKGGNMVVAYNGLDVWDDCEPPVPYLILGRLESEGGRFSNGTFELKMVLKGAKEIGADAVIVNDAQNWPNPEAVATAIRYIKLPVAKGSGHATGVPL